MPSIATAMSDVGWGQALLFATTIAGFGYQWLREARHHRWQQEEQIAQRNQQQELKRLTELTATKADAAYHEANAVNIKIHDAIERRDKRRDR